jgi:Lectin C-type domain
MMGTANILKPFLFTFLYATLTFASQLCTSPSAVDFESCTALSTTFQKCLWCKGFARFSESVELPSFFCVNSKSEADMSGRECNTSNSRHKTKTSFGNSSVPVEVLKHLRLRGVSDKNRLVTDTIVGPCHFDDGDTSDSCMDHLQSVAVASKNQTFDAQTIDIVGNKTQAHFGDGLEKKNLRKLQITTDATFCNSLHLNPVNAHLYGRQFVSLNFSAAQVAAQALPTCCGRKAHLVTIGDSTENEFVERIVRGLNQQCWIGLGDWKTEGNFLWVDSTPRNFTKWSSGEPNDFGGNEDCVEIRENGISWNDISCQIVRPNYIFEYDCDSFCNSLPMNPSNSHLYGRHLVSLNYSAAQASVQALPTCCGKKAHLVTIGDATENAIVETIVRGLNQESWIGLGDWTTEGNFSWVDSTPRSFTKWSTGEPNNVGGDEDCVEINRDGTSWNDISCQTVRPNYIFEYDCDFCSTLAISPNNLHLYGHKLLSTDYIGALTATEALPMCCGKNAHLVTIGDSAENGFLGGPALGILQESWIGLGDWIREGDFFWLDSTPGNFTYWAPGEPTNESGLIGRNNVAGESDCVKMDPLSRVWRPVRCDSNVQSFIFEYDCDTYCNSLAMNPSNSHYYGYKKCDTSYRGAQGITERLPMCYGKKAHLVTIGDSTENTFVERIVQGLDQESWIGLGDSKTEGDFLWVDSTPRNFTKWSTGEPKNSGGNEDCVKMGKNGTSWSAIPCDFAVENFIFEYDRDIDPFCESLAMNPNNSHYYGHRSLYTTFSGAQAAIRALPMCCGKKAHVVTIGDPRENSFVASFVRSLGDLGESWIGLGDWIKDGDFLWVDSTRPKWVIGQLQNTRLEQDCGKMLGGMFLGVGPCKNPTRGFIFEYDCVN